MIASLVDWLTDPANWSGADGIPVRLGQHLVYSVVATMLALAIGVPAGLYIGHTGRGTFLVAGLANALRALPTLGLLILAVLLLLPRLSGDLGFVIGPLVAGWSAQAFGFGASFAINAIPAVVALGLVLSIRETMHARRPSEGRGL